MTYESGDFLIKRNSFVFPVIPAKAGIRKLRQYMWIENPMIRLPNYKFGRAWLLSYLTMKMVKIFFWIPQF